MSPIPQGATAALALLLLLGPAAGCLVPAEATTLAHLRVGERAAYQVTFPQPRTYELRVEGTGWANDAWGRARPVVFVAAPNILGPFDGEEERIVLAVDEATRQVVQWNITGTRDEGTWAAHHVLDGHGYIPLLWPLLALPLAGRPPPHAPWTWDVFGIPVTYTFAGWQGGLAVVRARYAVEEAPPAGEPWRRIEHELDLRLRPDAAFPESLDLPKAGLRDVLRVTERAPGRDALPFEAPSPVDPAPLPRQPWRVHPANGAGSFPFPLSEAVAAARGDDGVAEFFARHPDAFLVSGDFAQGEDVPGVTGTARWELTFGAPRGHETQTIEVERRTSPLGATTSTGASTRQTSDHPLGDRRTLPPELVPVSEVWRIAGNVLQTTPSSLRFEVVSFPDRLERLADVGAPLWPASSVLWHATATAPHPEGVAQTDLHLSAATGERFSLRHFVGRLGGAAP